MEVVVGVFGLAIIVVQIVCLWVTALKTTDLLYVVQRIDKRLAVAQDAAPRVPIYTVHYPPCAKYPQGGSQPGLPLADAERVEGAVASATNGPPQVLICRNGVWEERH